MSQRPISAWAAPSIATATVRAIEGARADVDSASFGAVSARLAIDYRLRAGDAVLVAAADEGFFVIGVVRALREARDGSSAALETDGEGEVWRLRDASGRLLFEHRAGASVLHAPRDLELRAEGDLVLAARGEVRIESDQGVRAQVHGPIDLASDHAGESRLRLDGDRARLESGLIETKADRADLKIGEVNVVSRTLRTVAHRLFESADVVERKADRIVERAREAFREVEELSQTKAGRLRLVADRVLSLLGQQTHVKAEADVKINGEKIYLG